MRLLLATTNPGKAREIAAALAGVSLEITTLDQLSHEHHAALPPAETGTTYADNAEIKAAFWCSRTGLPTLADDSGIIVDALANELGVTTRRWGLGESATDEAWLAYFLERMADVPDGKRTAEFVCALALAIPPNHEYLTPPSEKGVGDIRHFSGRIRGTITRAIAAPIKPGIPLSSVFRPDGAEKVFAAMMTTEKEKWSHRGRALAALKRYLATLLA